MTLAYRGGGGDECVCEEVKVEVYLSLPRWGEGGRVKETESESVSADR